MNDHLTEPQLNGYADGSLAAAECAAVERHLAGCALCRAEVEALRGLLHDVAALPRSIEPPRELWGAIERRIQERGERGRGKGTLPGWQWMLAAAVLVVALGTTVWVRGMRKEWPEIAAARGASVSGKGLRPGETLVTDDSTWVRLRVGRIGAVQVEPGSRIRLLEAGRGVQRLALDRGTIHARILAKPRVFVVETPSATAIDLGCAYTLTVDSVGNGVLHVTSGWVEFAWKGRVTVVPRDAFARTRPGVGPGTAYAADASAELRRALDAFDFGGGGDVAARTVLALARPADALSLLNLLPRVTPVVRGALFDRLIILAPPPASVTRDGILHLDQTMLNRWWDRVAPPRIEKFDPENFGPATSQGVSGPARESLAVETVFTGLDNPVYVTAPAGDPRLFVVEQPGRIRVARGGRLMTRPFLDITSRVGSGGERGLLSMAFHPRYAVNGFFYVNYTDRHGDTRIERFHVSADPDVADSASAKLILGIAQPYANHNGGHLLFGPDGMLYIPTGDGGAGGDPHGNGQNPNALLGKLLRVDVDHGDPYAIPADNPFARGGGRGEIWARGLRNPWRIAFDAVTGLLYIADVGQNRWEEVNVQPAATPGLNYGWNKMEGSHCYGLPLCGKSGLVLPAVEYDHDSGCSVIGGFVYRGRALPFITGQYFYSDWCRGWLRSIRVTNGRATSPRAWEVAGGPLGSVVSFGQDAAGELYIASQNGNVYRLVAGR